MNLISFFKANSLLIKQCLLVDPRLLLDSFLSCMLIYIKLCTHTYTHLVQNITKLFYSIKTSQKTYSCANNLGKDLTFILHVVLQKQEDVS